MVTNHDRKSLNHAEKIPKVAQMTGTIDVFDPCSGISGPTSQRASACPNLHEWWTQPAHVRWPVDQLLSCCSGQNQSVFRDQLVNFINNLQGGNCFGSSRTRRITGGKITFELGHPVFDSGVRWGRVPLMFLSEWCEFPSVPCLAGRKTWRKLAFHVVEIAHVAWHASLQPL